MSSSLRSLFLATKTSRSSKLKGRFGETASRSQYAKNQLGYLCSGRSRLLPYGPERRVCASSGSRRQQSLHTNCNQQKCCCSSLFPPWLLGRSSWLWTRHRLAPRLGLAPGLLRRLGWIWLRLGIWPRRRLGWWWLLFCHLWRRLRLLPPRLRPALRLRLRRRWSFRRSFPIV